MGQVADDLEVTYEAFMHAPHELLSQLYAACRLEDAEIAHRALDRGPQLRNMNDKYRSSLSADYIERLSSASEPLLSELGYA